VVNARAAADLGATVLTRTACIAARRSNGGWRATLRDGAGNHTEVTARALVNATGPWARKFLVDALCQRPAFDLKLVKGSHIVVPRLYEGEHAFILQNDDRRVVFACPYEKNYTLIGTTDVELRGEPRPCQASGEEVAYLCRAANRYFARQLTESDAVWSYCGVRPLFDDGAADPSAVTRDYVLQLDAEAGAAPLLSVIGGKITTYRRLAERALEKLAPWFPRLPGAWTANAALPGGELGAADPESFAAGRLKSDYPWLPEGTRRALARRHGTDACKVLGKAGSPADLGEYFGAGLHAREIDYLLAHEWALAAEDVLWRRTKCGLHLAPAQIRAVARYVAQRTR